MVKGGWRMGCQVIHHQDDLLSMRILDVDHFLHEVGPILARFLLAHLDHPFAYQRLTGQEQVVHLPLLVAVVVAL